MRRILDFNENWWFIHADVDVSEARPGEGELVSLPHTWNALDGQKGDGTYGRADPWKSGSCIRRSDAASDCYERNCVGLQ